MKIKKQFFLLAFSIISIPLLCVLYILIDSYIKSPKRVLVKGYKEIRRLDQSYLQDLDIEDISKIFNTIPPGVEFSVISNSFEVKLSTIPDLQKDKIITEYDLWQLLEGSATKNFYQFTISQLKNDQYLIITRVPRNTKYFNKQRKLVVSLIGFLFFLVFLLVTYVVFIFRSISKSITTLSDKTIEISEGNLQEKITISKLQTTNEITALTEGLEKMRLSLIEAQQQKNKFIMGMSHDLRTPVAIIKGYIEALYDKIITSPEEVQDTLELISVKTNQLEEMINTLINFMKLNSSEIRNNLISQPLFTIINDFSKDFKISGQVFNRKTLSIINIDEKIMVPYDYQLLYRAFENLFSNALRYTKEGDSITLIAENNTKDNTVLIKINDTGCGIEEKDLKNIFDLFYRGTNSRREEGMGIGLSVVKNIIDTHGWSIQVKSKKNEGTSFIITIPYNIHPDKL